MKREIAIPKIERKNLGFFRLFVAVFLTIGMFLVPGVVSSQEAHAAGTIDGENAGMDTAWTAWTEGDKTIPFTMNDATSTATVSLPKGMQLQFGVVVTVTEDPAPNRYTYLFRDGTGVTSGTGYSINTTDVTSLPKAYIPRREDTPQRSSSYYSSSNAVRAKGTIADATNAGITLEYEQTLYFSSSGIIQTTTFKNAGTNVLSNFALLNKVDTMLSGNDKIPVYYGAKKFQYYLRDPSNEIQRDLYVEATDGSGVASSRGARYQVSNPRGMAITGLDDTWSHAEGDLAFNAGDSEIMFVNAPRTLGAGQSQSSQFRVFFKEHGAVDIEYLNKDTKAPMKVPDSFKTAIVGEAGDPYSMTQPSIDGYRSAGIAEDSAPESGTLTADLPSPVIKYLYVAGESAVKYDGNGSESGSTDDTVGTTNQSVKIADNGFVRPGYTFTGWNTKADGSGTAYAVGDPFVLTPSELKLFAQWKADPAVLLYDGNGADSGSTSGSTGITGQSATVADNGFTRSGYSFTGWNTEADGSGTAYEEGASLVLKPGKSKLFAQWKADKAKITYDGNGAESGSTDDTVGVTDENVTVADNGFVRPGYTFTGWNTEANGSGTAYAAGDEVTLSASELKLFAQWKADPAVLLYDGNGSDSGSTENTVGVTDQSVTVADNGFARAGYTFTGWNTKADGSGTAYAEGDPISLTPGMETLFAQWDADEAKITYDGNGAESGSTDDTVGVTDQSVTVADNGFTRAGYTFTGWNTAADGSGTAYAEGDSATLTPSGPKLFAQWKADKAKITYDGNGSESGSVDDTVGVTDESVSVAGNGFTRPGYTFTGWNTAADGSGDAYEESDAFMLKPVESTLFAQWKADEADITYDGNGSESGSTDDTIGVTDEKVSVAGNGFVHSGYTFTGWNTEADGSGTVYEKGDEIVLTPSELKLYAQWKADPAVLLYDGNGADSGSTDNTVGVTDESITVADNGFTRDGYTFTGWNTAADGSGTSYAEGDPFVLSPSELKLFAQWKVNPPAVTPGSDTTPGSPSSKVTPGTSGSKLTPSSSSKGVEKTTNLLLAQTGAGVGIFVGIALLAAFVGAAVLMVSRWHRVSGSGVSRKH